MRFIFLIPQLRDGKLYFYQNDHLGKPERVLKANGEVAWSGDYSAFGEVNITTELVENNLRFPGQYFDLETGSYYNFHRDYLPGIGRYLEGDPIGLGGGMNTYSYAYENSLSFTDPTGEIVPLYYITRYVLCVIGCNANQGYARICAATTMLGAHQAACLAGCVIFTILPQTRAVQAAFRARRRVQVREAAVRARNTRRRQSGRR